MACVSYQGLPRLWQESARLEQIKQIKQIKAGLRGLYTLLSDEQKEADEMVICMVGMMGGPGT
jgi:hypothetical protein